MMVTNRFGRLSELRLTAEATAGITTIRDAYFTAPFKLANLGAEGGIAQAMVMCASAGLLQGDEQALSFHIRRGAQLRLRSQSYEKVFAIEQGTAARHCTIGVERDGMFLYSPLPVIPYRDAAFAGDVQVELEDQKARLAYLDVVICGRYAHGERFAYRSYAGDTSVRRAGRLIYRDHTLFVPEQQPLSGMGFYEGFNCYGSLLLCGFGLTSNTVAAMLPPASERMQIGVTALYAGDLLLKILSVSAQELLSVTDRLLSQLR